MSNQNTGKTTSTEAADQDVVTVLLEQHALIKTRFTQVKHAAEGKDRTAALRELVQLLVAHEIAEQEVVHPAVKRLRTTSAAMVDERLHEESEAERLLAQLDRMDTGTPLFLDSLESLRKAVVAHADAEEQNEFPLLRRACTKEELAKMARAVRGAELIAPTHPHPDLGAASANVLTGTPVALADRIRDALRPHQD